MFISRHPAALVPEPEWYKDAGGGTHPSSALTSTQMVSLAYKQVPLSDEAFEMDSFLVVYSPLSKGPEVYRQRVLPFGSVASVTAFLRLALALWKVGTKLLGLMWSSYFDDFFSLTEKETSRHTDSVISAFFSVLGCSPMTSCFRTIRFVKSLEWSSAWNSLAQDFLNTEDRVAELCESLDEILMIRRLKRSEGEKLRGRLIFAAGQLFGRFVRNQVRHLSNHIRSGRANLPDETAEALQLIRNYIHTNVPRKIVGTLCDHVHIYVDASFDDWGYSGLGGAIYDSEGNPISFFSEELSRDFLETVRSDGQVTVIQELEMLALLIAVRLWFPEFKSHRFVAFTDSESVRGAFLKTWSNNTHNSRFLTHIFQMEEDYLCQLWLERVPSQSNPSDCLSRKKVESWKGLKRRQVDCQSLWNEAALLRGKCAAWTRHNPQWQK